MFQCLKSVNWEQSFQPHHYYDITVLCLIILRISITTLISVNPNMALRQLSKWYLCLRSFSSPICKVHQPALTLVGIIICCVNELMNKEIKAVWFIRNSGQLVHWVFNHETLCFSWTWFLWGETPESSSSLASLAPAYIEWRWWAA
jgi:hypothetical protein